MGIVKAVCISEIRGVAKENVGEGLLIEDHGLEKDAHAGTWHRQVSLLSYEAMENFRAQGAPVREGSFGENLLVSGFDFKKYPIGTRFCCGEAVLEITQVGKECHQGCEIRRQTGDCIMPREGVFAKVIKGGPVGVGDVMTRQLSAAVLVCSDKGSRGIREDASGPAAVSLLEHAGYQIFANEIIPDEQDEIEKKLVEWADERKPDLVFTLGGTGLSGRDVTPEATLHVADRQVPGVAEAIRGYSMQITPRAMFSRGVCVQRRESLIINLPGSPKAVTETLKYLLPNLEHGIRIMRGETGECAGK